MSANNSKFASSFAPYAPPPDEPSSQSSRATRPWFPAHAESSHETSYQSGAIPSFGSQSQTVSNEEDPVNEWETSLNLRLDVLAAAAYLLGPLSALFLLVTELKSDFLRFHGCVNAYQSALLTSPLVVIRISASLLHFTPWIRTLFTVLLVLPALYMAFRAYRDAFDGLVRFELPFIGPLASDWLSEE